MNDLTHFNKRSPIFIIILGSLTAIGALSIDMFLPGLPDIRHDFQTTTSNAQLTLSMFMIGLAFGNLFAGPISDSTGRRKPLIIAMIIFTLASLGIVFVHNIWLMVALRFLQGVTGGAAAVISRAIASDMYSGNELTKFMALLMLVNGIATSCCANNRGHNFKLFCLAYGLCHSDYLWLRHGHRFFIKST